MGPRGQPRRAQEYAKKGGTRNRERENHAHRASIQPQGQGSPAGRDMNVDKNYVLIKTTRGRGAGQRQRVIKGVQEGQERGFRRGAVWTRFGLI